MTGIHNVIKDGRYRQFCLLMKLGVDVNYPYPEDGLVPLMRCCYIDNDRYANFMTKALLDHGANKAATDRIHRNCLVHAVLTNRISVIKILLEVIDFNVNQLDDADNTLLHHVAINSGEEMARLVISRLPLNRTNVDKANKDGLTPLMCACVNGNLEVAQVLVNEGNASLTVRDNLCFRNALEWLRSAIFVPKAVNPFGYGYKPEEGKFIEIDGSALKLNLPPSLAIKRSKTSLVSTLGAVNQNHTPALRHRSISAPPRKDRFGDIIKRDGSIITSPSVDDLSDMRSAESRIRLMRDRDRYNNTQLLRQMFMKYETQLCHAYRPSAIPLVSVTVDDCESEDSYCTSSQGSFGRTSQVSGRFKRVESVVESAMFIKNKLSRRPSRATIASRASSLSRIGRQNSAESSGTMSGSSSPNSDKFREKMRKTQSKLVNAKRAISQPALFGDGGGVKSLPTSVKERDGSLTSLPAIAGSPA